jgi:glutamate-1-semialdehyde 2,1-aminomutase
MIDQRKTRELYAKAKAVIPYGVSSNFRYWGDEKTLVMERGQGSHIWDPDGNEYIDYRLGFGPVILGHGHPAVVQRVAQVMAEGTSFAFTTPLEIQVAERIISMCPAVEMVRFANSGTEATMHALRLARAYTGRELILKFEGHYHGAHDYLLFSTASADPAKLGDRSSPIPLPSSRGIPRLIQETVISLPFNDPEVLEDTLRESGHQVAAIILEPLMGNFASVEPIPGYLELVRRLCDEYGIVMIMDEVKTGFRIASGGAQEVYGVHPDLATYAKSIANGFPLAAFGGRREIMQALVPGSVTHVGTYNANLTGIAAADATLAILAEGQVYATLRERGERLKQGISEILTEADLPHQVLGPPSMFGVLLTELEQVRDYRDFAQVDHQLYERLVYALIQRGSMPEPDCREPWFLSAAHSQADLDDTLNAIADAVKEAKAAGIS